MPANDETNLPAMSVEESGKGHPERREPPNVHSGRTAGNLVTLASVDVHVKNTWKHDTEKVHWVVACILEPTGNKEEPGHIFAEKGHLTLEISEHVHIDRRAV